MQSNDNVYTITEDNIATLTGERTGRERGRNGPRPDRRPSSSMRGSGADGGSPLAAATLSLFFCGAGQIYNGQGQVGALMLVTQILVGACNWAAIQLWPRLVSLGVLFGMSEWNLLLSMVGIDLAVVLMMLAGIHQAYRFADGDGYGFSGTDNPIVAGMASLVLPGWGQLVNAQAGKAVFFLFAFLSGVGIILLTRLTPFLPLLGSVDAGQTLMPRVASGVMVTVGAACLLWVISVYDAILVAGFRRRMN